MAHAIEIIPRGGFDYTFRCSCGATTKNAVGFRHRDMAVDAGDKHLRDVERLKATMRGNHQTLEQAAKFYREQADNPEIDKGLRETWKQLAWEAEVRLGMHAPPSKQEELFGEDVVPTRERGRSNIT
jgi:hypothetical protein